MRPCKPAPNRGRRTRIVSSPRTNVRGFFLDLIAMLIRRQSNNLLDLEVPVSSLYLLAAPLEGLLKRIS